MFDKLSFEELARFYGALSELEKHYGKEKVHQAAKEMAGKLDGQKQIPAIGSGGIFSPKITIPPLNPLVIPSIKKFGNIFVPKSTDEQLELLPFEPDPEETKGDDATKERKKRKPKQTSQRTKAENVAKEHGMTLEEFLIDRYYIKKQKQSEIAETVGVVQETISAWIRSIPQRTIQRIVGDQK